MATRVGLVLGDPAGIGAELAAKLLAAGDLPDGVAVTVIGDARQLAAGARVAGVALSVALVDTTVDRPSGATVALIDRANADPAEHPFGKVSAAGGRAALDNYATALDLAARGALDAICFTPFNKQALKLGGNPLGDELEYAADRLGHRGPHGELNVLDGLWNARVTSHVPLARVSALLTVPRIVEAAALADACMRAAGVAAPRLAVAALNPHAGDGGAFGREEIDVIGPAVAEARARGIDARGPFPADTVWLRARDGEVDGVLSMYHDQGQIALKLLGFERGVTVLGGLPVPITTPAHGTAYDIAGRGVARVSATRRAFEIAAAMGGRARSATAA